jgi:tRNA synthetases class I (E and Q), anti-codon binding domain
MPSLPVANPIFISFLLTDRVETFVAERHPKRLELGTREIPFSGSVYIDREDFFDTGVDGSIPPPKGFKRLLPGGQVRLKYAYVITCDSVVRNEQGEVVEVVCSYDDQTRAGATPEGSKKVSSRSICSSELMRFRALFRPHPGCFPRRHLLHRIPTPILQRLISIFLFSSSLMCYSVYQILFFLTHCYLSLTFAPDASSPFF